MHSTSILRNRIFLFVASICCASGVLHAQEKEPRFQIDSTGYRQLIKPFLKAYCANCHESNSAEAGLDIEVDLPNEFLDLTVAERWAEVVDVLNSHEMPPEDETQPDPEHVAKVVDWITAQIVQAETISRSSQITIRRLNKNEYRNTIRDMLGIKYEPDSFPQDPAAGGFDNNGSALNLSALHLELYYNAAREILDRALVEGEQPETIRWRFEHEEASGDYNLREYGDQKIIVHGGDCRKEGNMTIVSRDQYNFRPTAREIRLKDAGEYVIRVRVGGRVPSRQEVVDGASAFYSRRRDEDLMLTPDAYEWAQAQYEKNMEPFKSNPIYDYGAPRLRIMLNKGGQPEKLDEFDINASHLEPHTYESKTRFTTDNSGIELEYAYSIPKLPENDWFQHEDGFPRPEVWLDWTELEGPIYETWPPESHKRIIPREIPETEEAKSVLARVVIENFATMAYRRRVSIAEVDAKFRLYEAAAAETESFIEAIKAPLAAVLVSPNFLFMAEPDQPGVDVPRKLNDVEIASRLSFFLWSSQPDQVLRELVDDRDMTDPEVLVSQVDRMLKDVKAQRFTKNFSGQWLGLREVGANPPVAEKYPHYDTHVEHSIINESYRFFHEIMMKDLSCENFIRSDFVVINERLARYYNIPDVKGDNFRPVKIPNGIPRGGIMTQASMLTTTSNGTRTSPVNRGVWILKNVLGTDPGLPVANAGEISPKVPGIDKATVRQRLEIHRELPQCARCHNKIDPLGFALENFDAAGRWREKEKFSAGPEEKAMEDPSIDASAKLPDGTEINGIEDLQSALVKRKSKFYYCFAEKMFTYALGRELGVADRPTIEAAVDYMNKNNETIRSLIKFIVTSDAFLTK